MKYNFKHVSVIPTTEKDNIRLCKLLSDNGFKHDSPIQLSGDFLKEYNKGNHTFGQLINKLLTPDNFFKKIITSCLDNTTRELRTKLTKFYKVVKINDTYVYAVNCKSTTDSCHGCYFKCAIDKCSLNRTCPLFGTNFVFTKTSRGENK